jgi:hypothetical protein
MVATLSALPKPAESILDLAKRLADLLEEAGEDSTGGQLPEGTRERAADLVEGLRRRVARNRKGTCDRCLISTTAWLS